MVWKRLKGLFGKKTSKTLKKTKPKPRPVGGATGDMMIALVSQGLDLDSLAAMYPDVPRERIERTVQKALKQAPMFLDD